MAITKPNKQGMDDLLFKMKCHQQWLDMKKRSFQQAHRQNISVRKHLKLFIRQYLRKIEFNIAAIQNFEVELDSDPIIKEMFNFIASEQKKAKEIWSCTQQDFLKSLENIDQKGKKLTNTSENGQIQQFEQQILTQIEKDLKYYDKLIAIINKISEKQKENIKKSSIQLEDTQSSSKNKKYMMKSSQQLDNSNKYYVQPDQKQIQQTYPKITIQNDPEARYKQYKQTIKKEMQKQVSKKNYQTEPIFRKPIDQQQDISMKDQSYHSKTQPRKKIYSYLEQYQKFMSEKGNENPERDFRRFHMEQKPVQYELRRNYDDHFKEKDYWKAPRIPQYKSIQQRIQQHNRYMQARKAHFHASIEQSIKRFHRRTNMETDFPLSSKNIRHDNQNKWLPFTKRQTNNFDRVQQQFNEIRRKLFSPYEHQQNPKIRQKLTEYSKNAPKKQQKKQDLDDSLEMLKQQQTLKKVGKPNYPMSTIIRKEQMQEDQFQKNYSSPPLHYQIFKHQNKQFNERGKEKTLESLLEESQLSDNNEPKDPYTVIQDSELQRQLESNLDQIHPMMRATGKFGLGSSIKLSQIAQFNNSRNSMIEQMLDSLQKAQQFTFGY